MARLQFPGKRGRGGILIFESGIIIDPPAGQSAQAGNELITSVGERGSMAPALVAQGGGIQLFVPVFYPGSGGPGSVFLFDIQPGGERIAAVVSGISASGTGLVQDEPVPMAPPEHVRAYGQVSYPCFQRREQKPGFGFFPGRVAQVRGIKVESADILILPAGIERKFAQPGFHGQGLGNGPQAVIAIFPESARAAVFQGYPSRA